MTERKIGEKFQHEGVWLEVVEGNGDCESLAADGECFFRNMECKAPQFGPCTKSQRIDGKYVAFLECNPPSAYQPTDETIECPVPYADACHNRYNGACLGDEECLEVDRPGLSDRYCLHCEKQGTDCSSESKYQEPDCDCDDEGAGFVAEEPCRYDPQSRYYDAGGIEVLEIIKAKLKPEQFRGYLLGNVIKYATRLEFKGQAERDAEKLARYAGWMNEAVKGEAK